LPIGALGLWALGETLNVGTVLVISITLGIAVDDTVHILTDYQRRKRAGQPTARAFEEVFTETGVALVSTTLVLVCAFGMSVFASFAPYQIFGILAAFVLSMALLADLFFLPALFLRKADSNPRVATAPPAMPMGVTPGE
jgi:uncharacterized protein